MEGVLEGTLEAVLRESIVNTVENLEKNRPQTFQNRAMGPLKLSFGASKIELGALQDAIFTDT